MNLEEEIFDAAAALPEGERAAHLDEACAGRPEMREKIEVLLRSHEACGFMEDRTELTEASPAEQAGERIGRYRLLQQIGEGGFGTVWMAEQFEPVTRRVALKIIKAGMDTKEVIARFEAERQALAMMDHPNIARVFDAGATDKGRPFFVMELVEGVPITRFCDEHQFTTRQRLELLADVCSAINHAHQKGIIHRDIKPSNVMVTLHGDKPVPKVIDFGIAKATQGKLTDHTLFTRFEQFVGTPAYMSPEQTALSGLDIDTRSDIYALGILLYELLTGKPPFDAKSLLSASYEEMSRIIREVEPARPSARLRSVKGDERTALAESRLIAPEKLDRLVEPDLDWIVMKAIEKDRARRYETANGLAQDIRRYLADEPVSASPPSAAYQFRKFARRHRLALAAAGSTAAALIIGLTVALNSLLDERKARADEAEQRRIAGERTQQALTSAREAALSDLKARRFLYAADMNLVQQALRSDRIDRARLLLDRHRPEIGTPDLRGWEWRYLWQECRSGAQRLLMHRDGAPVSAVSFSPDGTQLLAGYFDGRVELWDIAEERIRQLVQSSSNRRAGAAFSPQGGSFASTMIPGTVRIIDVRTGAGVDIGTAGGSIRDLSYSRDGERLTVLTDTPNAVLIVSADDGGTVVNVALPDSTGVPCHAARLSPDKQRLYVVSGARGASTVRCASIPEAHLLWETPLGVSEEHEPAHHRADPATPSMDLSPDGRILAAATGGSDRQIQVLDAATGALIKTVTGHTGSVLSVVFSADGRTLASTSADQTIRLWETTAWTGHAAALRGHDDEVTVAAFSSDGRTLASGNRNGELLLWDTRLPRPPNGGQDLPSRFQSVAALPGSRMLLGWMPDGTAALIDLTTLAETPLPEPEMAAAGALGSIAFGTRQHPPGYLDETRLGLDGSISTSALSPDGQTLAVASENGQVGLYRAGNLAKIEIVRSHRGAVFGVAFSPDNQRLALMSGGARGIVLWDVTTRQDLITLPSRAPALCAVEFTDDGNTLIASPQRAGPPRPGECQFWRAPSWAEIDVAESVGGRWPLTSAVTAPPPPPAPSALKDLLAEAEREGLARRERLVQENRNLLSPAAVLSRLEEAAAAIARSSPPMNSRDALVLLQLATVQVWLGREKDHFATCQLAFRLAAGTETAAVVSRAAKAYCLIPSSDARQLETALRFARQAVSLASNQSNLPWYQLTLGMAEFRRQNYDAAGPALAAAEKAAAELEELQRLYVAAGFFRAMNLYRQSREQDARELFVAVAAKMKPLPTGGDPLLVGDYDDDLLCWLASEEARALIFPELPPLK